MSKSPLSRVVTSIGLIVAVVIAIAMPAAYLSFGYSSLTRHLEFKAELNAGYLAKYIGTYSSMWQYQRVRIADLLNLSDGDDTGVLKRVLEKSGELVLEEGDPVPSPTITARKTVAVAGMPVAYVETIGSLRPLVLNTAFVALVSSTLGLFAFYALKTLPLRALSRMTGELEKTNSHLNAALGNMSQGLCMFDAEGRVTLFNDRYVEMFRLDKSTLHGKSLLELFREGKQKDGTIRDPNAAFAKVMKRNATGQSSALVAELPDGRSIRALDEPLPQGGWVSTFEDVTAQRAAQEKIEHMALHDPLTNLPNRLLFKEKVEEKIQTLAEGQKLALLYIDLDRFKAVNDTLGHPIGDKLLLAVADRMRGCLEDGDALARLGGDEFAIVQHATSNSEFTGDLAAKLVECMGLPFVIEGHSVSIGASVGVALAPADASTAVELLKNADLALYRAKAEGGDIHRFFEPEMDRLMQARRTLELDLRDAVKNGELELHYQPLVELSTNKVSGFEALLRWRHPTRGNIPPLEFIPIAEETSLINPIGEWVIRTACEVAANWPADITIAVNLSPVQFKAGNLVRTVVAALAHSGLPAQRLELEITESVLLLDNQATLTTLRQLRALGVKISMDDFGTGYSSLSYLRSFPFDKIKIDRSFVRDLHINEDSRAIISAVMGLGKSLSMATTGEGVETEAEADYLRQEGCTQAQGYWFGKPMPAEKASELLAGARPKSPRENKVAAA